MLSLGRRMLVRDEPHTSAMDLSQTASSFARLCYPHGNYYLVTFLRSAVGGRRSLPCWDSNEASLFIWLLKINVQYWTRLYIFFKILIPIIIFIMLRTNFVLQSSVALPDYLSISILGYKHSTFMNSILVASNSDLYFILQCFCVEFVL